MRNISRRTLIRILLGATAAAVLPVRWTIRRVRGAVSRTEARFYRKLCVLLVLGASLALAPPACKARSVQEPVVAGAFYPADPSQLREMVSSFISRAGSPQVRGEILGLVAPHAGYVYSGPAAGHAYREIKGRRFDVVVVIAPSHTSPMAGVSVLDMDAYRTPLGEVIIDREAVGTLMERAQWIRHVPALFAREHSMEVHLPFLQVALEPGFRLVPVVMGSPSPGLAAAFADVLASAFRGRSVLYIASSDMSHYLPYDQAREMDGRTLEYIAGGEIDTLVRQCGARESELCGLGPVQVLMHLARKAGIGGGTVLAYQNSGDTAGDRSRVVGYGSIAFVNPEGGLSLKARQSLLALARTTLESYVREGKNPKVEVDSPELLEPGAAFVTLKAGGRLRGCIGQLKAASPLYRSVAEMTVSSCSRDRRFPPVRPEELPAISIEISVMSPFKRVQDVDEIRVGRDGLHLRHRDRSGVLLPQVPLEQGWDRDRYLMEICRKAGLPDRAWEEEGAELYRFTAQVFSE